MTQLVLDTAGLCVILPESRKDRYTAELTPLHLDVEMVSGRMVRELRGRVWEISYQYGFFVEEMKNRVIAACRKGCGEPIMCDFLPPESGGELSQGRFLVTSFSPPKFKWSKPRPDGVRVPLWADFSVSLREVKPSD